MTTTSKNTILPRAVARQVSHHVEAIKIFEPRRVPVVLRGEYGEINKYKKTKRRFVRIATDLIFFVNFSIKRKSDQRESSEVGNPSGAFKYKKIMIYFLSPCRRGVPNKVSGPKNSFPPCGTGCLMLLFLSGIEMVVGIRTALQPQ